MKRVLLLLLVSIHCHSQTVLTTINLPFNKTYKYTDFDAHYHAGMLISGFCGSNIYFWTGKKIVASFLGGICGTIVTIAKEEVYDRQLGRGVPSRNDKGAGVSGSFFCSIQMIIYLDKQEKEVDRIDSLKYSNLNQKEIKFFLRD